MISSSPATIRLLIAEDSPACRELLVTIFQNAPGVQVVGAARDGAEAVRLVKRLKPDVVTMDLFMPQMDGYEATRQIMAEAPCPIVVVSGRLQSGENDMTFNALQAGALSVLSRPTVSEDQEAFVQQVKLMAGVKVVRRRWAARPALPVLPAASGRRAINLVSIAASTGGPGALAAILGQLPADFPAPILVAQHITRGFVADLAAWLDKQTPLAVRLARHATALKPGEVLLAPDGCHLLVDGPGIVILQQAAPGDSYCPAADILFGSVARLYGRTAVGIILTGMGSDGASGLAALRQAGGGTIAQDEATSVIFGMPAAAIQRDAVETIQPLHKIAATLMGYI